VSWIPAGDQERFYLSPTTQAGPGQAVRGGVPVIFPQFSQRGPLPRHGLVRTQPWQWVEGTVRAGAAIGVLRCTDDAASRAVWAHGFALELTLVVSGLQLDIELAVTNTGQDAFEFHAALHSYFRIDDLQRARLKGLHGVTYEDMLTGEVQPQEFDPQSFVGAIDRLYRDLTGPLTLASALGHLQIGGEGFADAVVWNPGPEQAAALPDLPADDWPHFLCVEAAAVHRPVRLAPGQDWSARLSLAA
jgi:glucose-6-phosphate 1-epimerase